MAIESKPSPGGVLPVGAPSKRPLAPRVQLPASLPQPAREPHGRALAPGPTPPPAPAAPPQPAPEAPPAPEEAAPPRARSKSPVLKAAAVATEDQNAILAMFNLESEDPQERDSGSPRRSHDGNIAPSVHGKHKQGRGREHAGNFEEALEDFDRSARRPPPPGGAGGRRRSGSREALRLVADYASPEEGGTWEDAAEKKPGVELTEHREKPVDIMSKASSFSDVVIEWAEAPSQTQLLYPYGVDGPIVTYLEGVQPYAERHGDGLMSVKSAKMWIDRLEEIELEERAAMEKKWHGETRFNRQSFTWRQREHKLLKSSFPLPDGSFFAEAALQYNHVEFYQKSRETQHNLIVIPEPAQCWLIAHLAERHLPTPSAVFSKKKRGRGWHCAISDFEPVRKWYILPDAPEDPEEREQTISVARRVEKVHDGDVLRFEEAMGAMKNVCAYENSPGGAWIYCGISGEHTDESFGADKEESCKFQFLSVGRPLAGER